MPNKLGHHLVEGQMLTRPKRKMEWAAIPGAQIAGPSNPRSQIECQPDVAEIGGTPSVDCFISKIPLIIPVEP
jgi:hypothetical protein